MKRKIASVLVICLATINSFVLLYALVVGIKRLGPISGVDDWFCVLLPHCMNAAAVVVALRVCRKRAASTTRSGLCWGSLTGLMIVMVTLFLLLFANLKDFAQGAGMWFWALAMVCLWYGIPVVVASTALGTACGWTAGKLKERRTRHSTLSAGADEA